MLRSSVAVGCGAWLLLVGLAGCSASPDWPIIPRPQSFSWPHAVALRGQLAKPEGPGPFPAVVLLHGCGGLSLGLPQLQGAAGWYRARGFVTLILDSLGPRGVASVCQPTASPDPDDRAIDALQALDYLATLDFVDHRRVIVHGYSHGAWTVLHALDEKVVHVVQPRYRFAAGIAYYPYCSMIVPHRFYAPLLVLIGELDEWTPARYCTSLYEAQKSTEWPVRLRVYPGAHHGFDLPIEVQRSPINFKLVGGSPAAAQDAVLQAERFLRDVLDRR